MIFPPDCSLTTMVRPSLGYCKSLYEMRLADPVATVIHTTGNGPIERYKDAALRKRYRWTTPFDAAVWIYQTRTKYGPHYVIGQEIGEIAQVCPEDLCAWHVGASHGRAYRKPTWVTKSTAWWPKRWKDFKSPCELGGGALWAPYRTPPRLRTRVACWIGGGSVNANTIGIEVVPPASDPRGQWSDVCWAQLVAVVKEIHDRRHIVISQARVLTHSDANPLARSTPAGLPWDPSARQWSWSTFARKLNAPQI